MPAGKWTTADIPALTGKTALITGANSGIGYQAALALASHGAHVLLGVRTRAKGEAALVRLRAEAPSATAEIVELDMASLASIRRFTQGFARGLDILVNNAGVMALPTRELTEDGFERQFGTNHLGHFALTGLLLPHLLRQPSARVVTVSSLAHRDGKIDFDNLQSERSYTPWPAYNASKLANLLFAFELDRLARAAGGRIRSIPVHPGISRTNIFQSGPGTRNLKAIAVRILSPIITQTDAMGALPTLYAATSPAAEGGIYIGPDSMNGLKGYPVPEQPRPQALDTAVAACLWQVSEQLTGVTYPALG